jgi:hypothetical protein
MQPVGLEAFHRGNRRNGLAWVLERCREGGALRLREEQGSVDVANGMHETTHEPSNALASSSLSNIRRLSHSRLIAKVIMIAGFTKRSREGQ